MKTGQSELVMPHVIITTERLTIQLWSRADIADAMTLWGDPQVTGLIDARGQLTPDQVAARLEVEIATQEQHGVQYWRVVNHHSREFIGGCGLRPACSGESGVLELGVHLCRSQWGKGYASEAARAVIDHAFRVLGQPKLFAGHHPRNTASRSLLLKAGFQSVGTIHYPPTGLDHPAYELRNPAFPV